MMSAAINNPNSNMPGEYQSPTRAIPSRADFFSGGPVPPRPIVPPPIASSPNRSQSHMIPTNGNKYRPRIVHQRRRRSLTPEIVIEKRSHRHCSSRRHRVFTIPLDRRPTLGLRGPPRRVLQIERVPCRRYRRSRKVCYEKEYYPCSNQPESNYMVANPIPNPCLPATNNSASNILSPNATLISSFLNNLTPEAIENLPRQTVHLPPIHLPGSQADENTELHTVIFPVEIINPVDGTLSILQTNSNINGTGTGAAPVQPVMNVAVQPVMTTAVQPQILNNAGTVGSPALPRPLPPSNNAAVNPLMERFTQLFQRLRFPQTQPAPAASTLPTNANPITPTTSNPTNNTLLRPSMPDNPTVHFQSPGTSLLRPTVPPSNSIQTTSISRPEPSSIRSSLPIISQFDPMDNNNNNNTNIGPYPPANIRPYASVNSNTYPTQNTVTMIPPNLTPYTPPSNPPSSFTPRAPMTNNTYLKSNPKTSYSSDIGPYRPANITPYSNTVSRPDNNSSERLTVPNTYVAPTAMNNVRNSTVPSNTNINYGNSNATSTTTPIMPRSILRNPLPPASSNPGYTSLQAPQSRTSYENPLTTTV